jgi:membrane protein EpsK
MQTSSQEAKKRLVANIGTNLLVVLVGAAVSVWLTPYYIEKLGIAAYGMIPLVVSFIAYFNLLTGSISNAVSRFVTIHLNKEEKEKSNAYFNTALIALVVLCGILVIPAIVISIFFSRLFQVPTGFEKDATWLFFLVISSSFVITINSPFLVSSFVTHRFDLANYVRIAGRLLRVALIVLCFKYLSPSLKYVGLSYVVMALFCIVCSVCLTKTLTPQLNVKLNCFNWNALREMGKMSTWIAINQVGALLYLSISFVIINIFLGPEQCGRYAPIALWVTLLGTLGGAISDVFAPIALGYIAHQQSDILVTQMKRSTKFLALIMALPVGLLCGLAKPILHRWLGQSFSDLAPLTWILITPWLITIAIKPMFSIFRGLDKVKTPALVTLFGGLVNIILAIVFVYYTELGIYGIALALLICLATKNLLFTPIYAAIITHQPKITFIKELFPGLSMALLITLAGLIVSRLYDLATIPRLTITCILMAAVYIPLCYGVIMTKTDRKLVWSLILRK